MLPRCCVTNVRLSFWSFDRPVCLTLSRAELFLKVMCETEEVSNGTKGTPCPGQSSANQREDKEDESASLQLRKRKKRFGRKSNLVFFVVQINF